MLRKTFAQVPRAMSHLRDLVDEFIEVDNDALVPRLRAARDVRALIAVCDEVGGDSGSRQLELWLPGF